MFKGFWKSFFLFLFVLCVSVAFDQYDNRLIQGQTSNQIYYVANHTKFAIWNGATFEALKLSWGDVHRVSNALIEGYPDGPKLDVGDPSFQQLAASVDPAEAAKPLKLSHTVKDIITDDSTLTLIWEDEKLTPARLSVCDNMIVNDMPGTKQAVLAAGRLYAESMRNFSRDSLEAFAGAWKWELFRVMGPMVPPCAHLKIFGDERANYDEAKRFCYFPDAKHAGGGKCVAYSIGSNNNWGFEEFMHQDSDCTIETFDCTINATIPMPIRDRTHYHLVCLGVKPSVDPHTGQRFMTLAQLNKLVGRSEGPDYLKMDIEGYEWAMLRSLVRHVDSTHNKNLDKHLPLQIYAEYHLDRESNEDNSYVHHGGSGGHVGRKLRHFFDELFYRGGYMIMHVRNTLQTRNTDVLLAKVFCRS